MRTMSCCFYPSFDFVQKLRMFVLQIAALVDRAALVYLAIAYDTGKGLGTRSVSWAEAVYWYTEAVEAVKTSDEEGNYDGLWTIRLTHYQAVQGKYTMTEDMAQTKIHRKPVLVS